MGKADRLVEVLALLAVEVLDQFEPPPLIRLVQIVAYVLLALSRPPEQFEGARLLAKARRKQPAANLST